MKSTPSVLETKGKDREALRLHSITWRDNKIQKKREDGESQWQHISILPAIWVLAALDWGPALVLPASPFLFIACSLANWFLFTQYLWILTFFHPFSTIPSLHAADKFIWMQTSDSTTSLLKTSTDSSRWRLVLEGLLSPCLNISLFVNLYHFPGPNLCKFTCQYFPRKMILLNSISHCLLKCVEFLHRCSMCNVLSTFLYLSKSQPIFKIQIKIQNLPWNLLWSTQNQAYHPQIPRTHLLACADTHIHVH